MGKLPACGALMAGGRSLRMGTNKALLPWQGRPLIAHVAARFQAWFDQVVIITNTPDPYAFLGLPMAGDRIPGHGPLAGIESALNQSRHPAVFCAACDLPFLDADLVTHLVGLLPGHDVVVPVLDGQFEPLHAVYARSCLPEVTACIDAGKHRITAFFDQVRVRELPAAALHRFGDPERLFFNCNTPADLEQAQRWAAEDD